MPSETRKAKRAMHAPTCSVRQPEYCGGPCTCGHSDPSVYDPTKPAASPPVPEPGEPDTLTDDERRVITDLARQGFFHKGSRQHLLRYEALVATLAAERNEAIARAEWAEQSAHSRAMQIDGLRANIAAAESRALAAEQRIEAIRGVLEQCRPAVEQHSAALTGLIDAALATLSPNAETPT